MDTIYIIDTSEWINLNRFYPEEIFSNLWKNLENLISKNRLFSPDEVLNELKRGNDKVAEWCRMHPKAFVSTDVMNVFRRS